MDNDPIAVGDTSKKNSKHRDDRDAKRKARSRSPKETSVPGAHASTGEHKSNRKKSSRKSTDRGGDSKHRSSRTRPSDDKASYRSSRSDGTMALVVPGAQAETSSSSQSRSNKRDSTRKGKERRSSTRATKPGAESSTSSRDRRSRTKSRSKSFDSNMSSHSDENPRSVDHSEDLPDIGEDVEQPVVAAVTVKEEAEDKDVKKQQEQARINQMVAEERQRMEAENQKLREEMESAKQKAKKCIIMLSVALVLVLVGAVVASVFAVQGASSSDVIILNVTTTAAPTSKMPSLAPSDSPSSSSTEFVIRYDPPSPEDCLAVSKGDEITSSQDGLLDRNFQIPLDVVLSAEKNKDEIAQDLKDKIQALLMPELLGCPSATTANRKLQLLGEPTTDNYVIANAVIDVQAKGGACVRSEKTPCVPVLVTIDLRLKGPERILTLLELINLVFGYDQVLVEKLQLANPYVEILLITIDPGTITEAPSMVPSLTASENPTVSPSTSPTFAPAIGPTTPAPIKFPSKTPSIAPSNALTSTPTLAPTPTPPPTAAPQPGVTPSPTQSPTISPSKSPSWSPSTKPSLRPSATPSTKPSVGPSAVPSTKPSLVPSTSPTIQASSVPSPAPTNGPTAGPTFSSGSRLGFVPLLRPSMIAEQSSAYSTENPNPASDALDGNYDSFSHTQMSRGEWWRVQVSDYYGQPVTVNKVTVWNRRDICVNTNCQLRLAGATVKLFGAGNNNLLATSAPLTSDLAQTVDFGEVTGVEWIQVIQESKWQFLHLAEVEAWGYIPNDVNSMSYAGLLRQGMLTEQTSTVEEGDFALDGNYDSISHTENGADEWWRVQVSDYYGQPVTVNKVTVWNRLSGFQERLEGAVVELFGEGDNSLLATSSPLTSDLVQTVDFGEVSRVEWVQVVQESKSDFLSIAQIEAWGRVP